MRTLFAIIICCTALTAVEHMHTPRGQREALDKTRLVIEGRQQIEAAMRRYAEAIVSQYSSVAAARLKIPDVGSDPRESEIAARDLARQHNQYAELVQKCFSNFHDGAGGPGHVISLMDDTLPTLLAVRARLGLNAVAEEAAETSTDAAKSKPKTKPKITAKLADGTVVEQ